MRQSVRLGSMHGIPVGLHWSTLVILVLLAELLAVRMLPAASAGYPAVAYWLAATGFAGLFLGGLLAHEYAHARAAQHYGVRVRSITLWMLGGVSELESEPPHPRADLLTALAGPAASLLTAGVSLAAAGLAGVAGAGLVSAGFVWLAVVNGVLAVFNMLPGAPLDGGRVLAAALWWMRGDRAAARRAAAYAGTALGAAMIGAGILLAFAGQTVTGIWLVLLGWYLAQTARAEAAYLLLSHDLSSLPIGRLMSSPPVCGYTRQTVSDFLARVAAVHPHRCYPLVDIDGHLAGLVTMAALARVPRGERDTVFLANLSVPAARLRVAQRDTPVTDPTALPADPLRLTVVLDGSRPCGVLTTGDLSRAQAVARLGELPDRSHATLDDPYPGRRW